MVLALWDYTINLNLSNMKYIDAERLNADLDTWIEAMEDAEGDYADGVRFAIRHFIFLLDSLQQDKETLELCSKIWWEEQGWIMIPPDATIEGIDSLLKQVRKKLQQEQPDLPGIEEPGIPGKDYIPVEWVDACEKYGKWKIVKQEYPGVELEEEINRFWDSCTKHKNERGGNVIWSNKLEVEVLASHFYELGRNARK